MATLTVVIATILALPAASALAAEAPVWKILATPNPTNLTPGDQSGNELIMVTAVNVGGAATDGTPVTIEDTLPAGLVPTQVSGDDSFKYAFDEMTEGHFAPEIEEYKTGKLDCRVSPTPGCTVSERVDPGDTLVVLIHVTVQPGLPESVPNEATVSGGGAPAMSVSNPVTISSAHPSFGAAPGGLLSATSTRQAGAHPDFTNGYVMSTVPNEEPGGPTADAKDVSFDLPPGLVGTTVGMPRCTMAAVIKESECPNDTMVGTATLTITGAVAATTTVPVFNIEPAPGEPVAFAFNAFLFPVRLTINLLSAGDYRVRVTAPDITEGAPTISAIVTIWGVPADHYGPGPDRAARQLNDEESNTMSFGSPAPGATRVALLTNPSQCSTPRETTMFTDLWEPLSWEPSGPGVFASSTASIGTGTGCNLLSFSPTISMLPDTLQAGAPAGYSLDLRIPQDSDPNGLAPPDVKKVVATLPEGTVVSPSAADGLGDCSNAQFGLHSGKASECPRDSQVGTVQISTPALPQPLQGEVYLGEPECSPCTPQDAQDGHMVRLLVQVIGEGELGIVVKLEGRTQINQQTGQLTAVFENNPQLPFDDFKLSLGGGERATLANPRTCGPVTTTLDLTPWSTPATPDATPTSTYDVTGCNSPQFNPSFSGGTTDNQAGEFTPFTLAFGRADADEFLNGLQMKLPPGLLGKLAGVTLCGEPQAAQGTCAPQSLIGHVTVETGPGADPFLVTGGQVFLTGPYKGAPYGLSIVVPAAAGPYTLSGTNGNGTVIVRAAISVDPRTAGLTVTADPLPTEIDGIPLQLRLVNVTVDRAGFIFNPTNCAKLSLTGTITSTEAASASVAAPFQVTNCSLLGFRPQFRVATSGRTSRANGASLDARLTYPSGVKFANIAKVKVSLPKQLPSRLTTLQKACTAATFEADPARCPGPSVIGIAKVSTPVLSGQLSGPVYFVSHGGEAFPSLVVVLQGEGVRVDLSASTFISKAGITSTTFNTVPDVPLSSFELYLPQGPYSALAANGNLCGSKLAMPTEFTAQNGAELHQSTKISVSGCPKVKKARAAHKARARKKGSGKAENLKSGQGRGR
jgi:hypothetical protein